MDRKLSEETLKLCVKLLAMWHEDHNEIGPHPLMTVVLAHNEGQLLDSTFLDICHTCPIRHNGAVVREFKLSKMARPAAPSTWSIRLVKTWLAHKH